MSADLDIAPGLAIPERELELTFARSGGPGGQNVNKVASKAVLRFDLAGSPSIPELLRARALAALSSRLTRAGEIVLSCDTHREQSRNRAEVVERFRKLLARAVRVPKSRRPTRPSRAARQRRLEEKKARSGLKQQRTSPPED